MLAVVAIILADQLTAIAAFDAAPTLQSDVGAGRVVGLEDLADEDEEVEQSPLSQGTADRHAAVAFAELVPLNVRMGGVGTGRRRVGIQGDHLVASPPSARVAAPVELQQAALL